MIAPKFVDHLVFRISALDRSEHPERTERSLLYTVGDTRLFFTLAAEPRSNTYDKEQIGLNHIAFGIGTLADLQAVQQQLTTGGIAHKRDQARPVRPQGIYLAQRSRR